MCLNTSIWSDSNSRVTSESCKRSRLRTSCITVSFLYNIDTGKSRGLEENKHCVSIQKR